MGYGVKSESYLRRKKNIEFITALPLVHLKYGSNEKLIHLYETFAGENLFLQYPGKESARLTNTKQRDFRPKIYNSKGQVLRDLSFIDVWSEFFKLSKDFDENDAEFQEAISLLMALFYKCIHLLDYIELNNPNFVTLSLTDNIAGKPIKNIYNTPVLLFDNKKNKALFDYLQQKLNDLCDMSVEGFVLYNEILAWNEDYKYYDNAIQNGKLWANATGRPNTLLTHIGVLGYIMGAIDISDILGKFVRTRGVAAPSKQQIEFLLDNYVNPTLEKF